MTIRELGDTALILASLNGRTETVALLLKNEANIEAKNKKGSTAPVVFKNELNSLHKSKQ